MIATLKFEREERILAVFFFLVEFRRALASRSRGLRPKRSRSRTAICDEKAGLFGVHLFVIDDIG